jgi:glycosyltransferase involved in cell wall biosynthesis
VNQQIVGEVMPKAKKKISKKILVVSSTFPSDEKEPISGFVKEQVVWLKKKHPELDISVLAPNDSYSKKPGSKSTKYYKEYRFHYFWPFRFEKLAGRGIAPALAKNKLLYFEIPFLIVFEFFAVLKYTKKLKPDIIYAHWFTPQAITVSLVSKITKTPFIYTTHSSDVIILKRVPFARSIVMSVSKQASLYTAVSTATSKRLLHFAKSKKSKRYKMLKSKLVILPMGAEEHPKVPKKLIDKIERKYNLGNKHLILYIGRVVERKGVSYLVHAFARLNKKFPDTHLVIAGEGQQMNDIRELCSELNLNDDKITLTGYVAGEEKYSLIERADILCIPSINIGSQAEGLPVVFMEALGAGKIIAASNVSGAEVHIKNGVNGYVFPQKNVTKLEESLESAMRLTPKERSTMRNKSRELGKDFSWPNIIDKYYKLFIENTGS